MTCDGRDAAQPKAVYPPGHGVQVSHTNAWLQARVAHEMEHGGVPRLGTSRALVYHLFGRTGSEGLPGAKNKFVVHRCALVCLFELAITQAVGVHRCWQAGTTWRGDSLHGLIRAGFPLSSPSPSNHMPVQLLLMIAKPSLITAPELTEPSLRQPWCRSRQPLTVYPICAME